MGGEILNPKHLTKEAAFHARPFALMTAAQVSEKTMPGLDRRYFEAAALPPA
jgi:hypothetical protein